MNAASVTAMTNMLSSRDDKEVEIEVGKKRRQIQSQSLKKVTMRRLRDHTSDLEKRGNHLPEV